ncbi:MAG: hypothetical protein WCA21_14870 [Terracidiphilus sp.]
MSTSILRLSFCVFLLAGLAGCGSSVNCGSCGGGGSTTVTYTITGPAPTAIATQIGSGAYTQATLTSGKLTISVPSGESNFSVAYLCPSPTAGPFINQEYINQASTLDGTSFSGICNPRAVQGGVATVQVDATAIPGAEGIFIGQDGCAACNTFGPSAQLAAGTWDVPIYVTGTGGIYEAIAAKILRGQTIPGALNGGTPVVFATTDETVPQTITYNNVPNGYSPSGGEVNYITADGTWVPLALGTMPAATQYMVMPSGTYQSGDYYEFKVEADNAAGNGSVSVDKYSSSAGPQSFTFPAPFSYAGPAAAALPRFNFTYSGFSGMSNISQQAAIYWGEGIWAFGIPADLDSITVTATANYQNGSTAMSIPDLSSLTGFLAPATSGTTVDWTAEYSQGDPNLTTPPSGSIQSVSNSGNYTEP